MREQSKCYDEAFKATLAKLDTLLPGQAADTEELLKSLLYLVYIKFFFKEQPGS